MDKRIHCKRHVHFFASLAAIVTSSSFFHRFFLCRAGGGGGNEKIQAISVSIEIRREETPHTQTHTDQNRYGGSKRCAQNKQNAARSGEEKFFERRTLVVRSVCTLIVLHQNRISAVSTSLRPVNRLLHVELKRRAECRMHSKKALSARYCLAARKYMPLVRAITSNISGVCERSGREGALVCVRHISSLALASKSTRAKSVERNGESTRRREKGGKMRARNAP